MANANKDGQAPAANSTATPNGEQKATRESRNNHAAAEAVAITNAATAQNFIDRVLKDTANDKPQAMYNSSGFTTPGTLERQEPANLVRMSVCISAALAAQVSADGERGEQAARGLAIIGEYAAGAGKLQLEAKNRATLAAAAAILKLPANASEAQIREAMAKQAAR